MLRTTFFMFLVLMGISQTPAHADEPFEVKILVFEETGYYDGIYYAPANNIIKIRNNGPIKPLKIALKNITSQTQRLNISRRLSADETSQGLDAITFEMTDEHGNKNVITKKVDAIQSSSQGYNYINPGETKEFEIIMSEREWNNAFKLSKQGATKVRGRASYKNGSRVIYSGYYTFLFER
ncbi:MAG: hypothetical protein ABH891_00130 [Candidatus Omnitrophota bacterium]